MTNRSDSEEIFSKSEIENNPVIAYLNCMRSLDSGTLAETFGIEDYPEYSKRILEAFRSGRDASKQRLPITMNPYIETPTEPTNMDEHSAWLAGFLSGTSDG